LMKPFASSRAPCHQKTRTRVPQRCGVIGPRRGLEDRVSAPRNRAGTRRPTRTLNSL